MSIRVPQKRTPGRTQQQGLLAAALAVREGRDIKAVLTANTFKNRTTWQDAGFRLLEATATNANHALLSWSIANEIAQRQGPSTPLSALRSIQFNQTV